MQNAAAAGLLLCATLAAGQAQAAGLDAPRAKREVGAVLDRDYPKLEALYRDLHAHPELGFQEKRTAARMAQEMRGLGLEVTEGVGGTGVVAMLRNGPGPTVLIRTELDGLPMEEKTGLAYASRDKTVWHDKETFTAHACGHDLHMAAWVGTARALIATNAKWSGTVMFVAQPSEESINGAKAMLADGLFKRFGKPDYAFALHVWPGPAGQVFYKPGAVSSSSYSLQITFNGRGGHGSTPSETIDPIMMASRFVVDVQSVISREKDPAAFGVVSIGSFQAGSAGNIIPDTATVRGTVRMQDAAVGERMADGIRRTAKAVADMAGAPAPTIALNLGAKAVINDPALTDRTAGVFRAAFGQDAVLLSEPMSGGEDFSDFIHEGVPSVFFRVGGSDVLAMEAARKGGAPVPVNHSPFFAPAPGPVIRSGVTAMSLAAMNVLAK